MQPRREDINSGHAPRVAAPTHKNDEKKGGGHGSERVFRGGRDASRRFGPRGRRGAARRGGGAEPLGLGPGFRGGGDARLRAPAGREGGALEDAPQPPRDG